jgi:hypothetical protein
MKKLLLPFIILLAACQPAVKPGEIDPANFAVKMARTACYGKCPVYSVSVSPDGKVVFEGIENTTTLGKAEATLDKAKMDQLAAAITAAKIFDLHDEYTKESGNCPDFATDHPSVTLSIESKGWKKSIRNDLGCLKRSEYAPWPTNLVDLEKKIDEIVDTKRWTGN